MESHPCKASNDGIIFKAHKGTSEEGGGHVIDGE